MKHLIPSPEDLIHEKFRVIPAVTKIRVDQDAQGEHCGIISLTDRNICFHLIEISSASPKKLEKILPEENSGDSERYQIVVAPYISDSSAEVCRKYQAGYLDYSGNCLIAVDSLYISDQGHPNLFPEKNQIRNIFKSKSVVTSKILRILLRDISKSWKLKNLSEEAGCSIGMISKVKDYLYEENWANTDENGLHITDVEGLLKSWADAYQNNRDTVINAYSLDSLTSLEATVSSLITSNRYNACFTGFSGGVRIAPVVRYSKVHIRISKKDVRDFLNKTELKEVDSGANVVLFVVDSGETLLDTRIVNRFPVASPVQLYLDLMNLKGRGEELAEAILTKEILK